MQMSIMRWALIGTLTAVLSVAHAETAKTSIAAQVVKVSNPYARAVPPGQPNSAVFLTLTNPSKTTYHIKAASSPASKVTELHTTQDNNGVMEMRQVPKMDIPALGETVLKPGSLHIMLIGLKQDMKVGEKTKVTLTFNDDSKMTLEVPIQEVAKPAGMGGMSHSMHSEHKPMK
jgi:hypothetical protein